MIHLYELAFSSGQSKQLDCGFSVFDNSEFNVPALREIPAFDRFSSFVVKNNIPYAGLFSPKFTKKTGLISCDILNFIEKNPAGDVYLFHPYPLETSLSFYFLDLAELEHPGITAQLRLVWDAIYKEGLPTVSIESESELCCHCNYFVASLEFWRDYSSFIMNYIDFLNVSTAHELFNNTEYNLTTDGDYKLPMAVFAFERCLTLFLKQHMEKYKIHNYTLLEDFSPVEVFEGERAFVNSLKNLLREKKRVGASSESAHKQSVAAYYHYRRLALLGGS